MSWRETVTVRRIGGKRKVSHVFGLCSSGFNGQAAAALAAASLNQKAGSANAFRAEVIRSSE
jgi:hypothetical protein